MNAKDKKTDPARGQRIRYVRADLLGMPSQEAFAAWVGGVTRGAVGNWERGGPISTRHLNTIAMKSGVPLDWLAFNRGAPPTSAPPSSVAQDDGEDAQLQLALSIYDALPDEQKKSFLKVALGLGGSGLAELPAPPGPASAAKAPQ